MIRPATIEDFPQWYALVTRLRDRTPYAGIAADQPTVAKMYSQCLNSKLGCVFVADRNAIRGTIMGVAQTLWWSTKRYATDLAFYSESPGDGRRLLRAFIDWAWQVPGVVEVTLGQSSGIDVDRTARLYERAGMIRVGAIYTQTRKAA